MDKLKRVFVCIILFLLVFLSLTGCKRNQLDNTPRYPGNAFDILSENHLMLERLVQLFSDHLEAFLLYDSRYSLHKDFPLYDNPNTNNWTFFSLSEREFVTKCKSELYVDNITLYEARMDTYPVLEIDFNTEFKPCIIYWIDISEDDITVDKLEHTIDNLLSSHDDFCYIAKGIGNNWYILQRKEP